MDRRGGELGPDQTAHSDQEGNRSRTGTSLPGQQAQKGSAAGIGGTAPGAALQVVRDRLRFSRVQLFIEIFPEALRDLFTLHLFDPRDTRPFADAAF